MLKENLGKAEEEISELDHIIDQVREVMHQEIGVVKHSPALLQLIRELDGVEAPNSYWIIAPSMFSVCVVQVIVNSEFFFVPYNVRWVC